jgi:hypothetical protein
VKPGGGMTLCVCRNLLAYSRLAVFRWWRLITINARGDVTQITLGNMMAR